ncbi:MAG: radical SAM protein [Candidatus Coatesbacteria bacterium]|nr:MAG: radical SAM protein [Candidatus Coatesbacteria bacterium]
MKRVLIQRLQKGVANHLGNKIMAALADGSDEQIIRMTNYWERLALVDEHKAGARGLREIIEKGHPIGKWLKRLSAQVNPASRKGFVGNVFINSMFVGEEKRLAFRDREGFRPPDLIVFSVTSRCNLNCRGCWAKEYRGNPDLSWDVIDRTITEAKEKFGLHFFTITGGEPFMRPDMLDLYAKHNDCWFLIYTNGTLITKDVARRLAKLGNTGPMLSVEGMEAETDARRGKGMFKKIERTAKMLRDEGVVVGFSVTATRNNVEVVSSDEFIDTMLDWGALIGWYFQYVPIGDRPDTNLMLTPEQRDYLRRRIDKQRAAKPVFLADFWNDGAAVDGCMAGGKRYLHINNNGDIEPCVFCHFAVDNIYDTTVTEALKSPFFRAIRERIPYDGNMLRCCMLFDRPQVFREHYRRFHPRPTHKGAESLVTDLAEALDRNRDGVAAILDKAWAEGDWQHILSGKIEKEERQRRAAEDRAIAAAAAGSGAGAQAAAG